MMTAGTGMVAVAGSTSTGVVAGIEAAVESVSLSAGLENMFSLEAAAMAAVEKLDVGMEEATMTGSAAKVATGVAGGLATDVVAAMTAPVATVGAVTAVVALVAGEVAGTSAPAVNRSMPERRGVSLKLAAAAAAVVVTTDTGRSCVLATDIELSARDAAGTVIAEAVDVVTEASEMADAVAADVTEALGKDLVTAGEAAEMETKEAGNCDDGGGDNANPSGEGIISGNCGCAGGTDGGGGGWRDDGARAWYRKGGEGGRVVGVEAVKAATPVAADDAIPETAAVLMEFSSTLFE